MAIDNFPALNKEVYDLGASRNALEVWDTSGNAYEIVNVYVDGDDTGILRFDIQKVA